MSGTTPIQLAAKEKRSKVINTGKHSMFREKGFNYLGDTVVVWNLSEYLDNRKWKEDALRKANKRRQQFQHTDESSPCKKKRYKGSGRKIFRTVMEDLYKKSLRQTSIQE
jgi:hypothetical protein